MSDERKHKKAALDKIADAHRSFVRRAVEQDEQGTGDPIHGITDAADNDTVEGDQFLSSVEEAVRDYNSEQ